MAIFTLLGFFFFFHVFDEYYAIWSRLCLIQNNFTGLYFSYYSFLWRTIMGPCCIDDYECMQKYLRKQFQTLFWIIVSKSYLAESFPMCNTLCKVWYVTHVGNMNLFNHCFIDGVGPGDYLSNSVFIQAGKERRCVFRMTVKTILVDTPLWKFGFSGLKVSTLKLWNNFYLWLNLWDFARAYKTNLIYIFSFTRVLFVLSFRSLCNTNLYINETFVSKKQEVKRVQSNISSIYYFFIFFHYNFLFILYFFFQLL